jgi:predicted Zn finger-like uncharacterized protein
MKVQCEQCGAAYSVADEKVAGRKLRQRCRKCGEPIIIDGSALEGASAATPGAGTSAGSAAAPAEESFAVSVPADSEAVWHIAVGDTTQGPYTLQELAQYYADGHIVLDTLVCRDGWADWKQAGEVPELVSASRDSAQASPAVRSSRGPMVPQHVAQAFEPVTMGSDPFGDAPAGGDAPRASLSPRVTMEEIATPGMQRDGTVQFSMDEIRALSAVSMPPVQPMSTTLPGHATHDDSGLIDMRALAAAEAEAAAAAAASPHGPNGYRPITPSQVSPLQAMSPLAFAQTARPPSGGLDTRTKVMAGLAALGLVLAAVVAVVALQRTAPAVPIAVATPASTAAAAQPPAPAAEPAPAPAAAEPAAAPEATAAAAADKPAAETAIAAAEPHKIKKSSGHSSSADSDATSSSHGSKRKGKEAAAEDKASDKPAAASKDDDLSIDSIIAKKPAPKKGSQSIDDLLDGAVAGAKKPAPKEEAPAASALPATPSRDEMKSAYGKATKAVSKCKGPGVATAEVTISGKSGHASSVNVTGVDGAAKSCVEKAVRGVGFPKFSKDSFEVKFPFKLAG